MDNREKLRKKVIVALEHAEYGIALCYLKACLSQLPYTTGLLPSISAIESQTGIPCPNPSQFDSLISRYNQCAFRS